MTRKILLVAVCCSRASVTRAWACVSARFFSCSSVEQPHVLDGNDGLVGEGLQQLDLVIRERPHLKPTNANRTDRPAVAQHWRRQAASIAERLLIGGLVCRVCFRVRQMDDRALENRSSQHGVRAWTHREDPLDETRGFSRNMSMGRQVHELTVVP
jgi:hypothetical protein